MRLTDEELAMRAGAFGPAVAWAIEHQIKVGTYLGADDFVPVAQAHIMADTESLGLAGVEWLERWARLPPKERRVRIPTITDPRGTDFASAHKLKHQPWLLDLERRGRAIGAERGADRPHAALRVSSRRASAGHARRAGRTYAARTERMGRA